MLTKIFGIILIISMAAAADADQRPLAKAFSAMEEENWELALELASQDGRIARDVIEWHIHRAQAGTAQRALEFIKRNPNWPGLPYFKKRSEKSFLDAPMNIRKIFFNENPPKTALGSLAFARTLEASGHYDTAKSVIRNAWQNYEMDDQTQRIFLSSYGSDIMDLNFKRLREMLWRKDAMQVRALYPILNEGELTLAKACLALYSGSVGVDTLIAKIPKTLRDEPVLSYARFQWRLITKKRNSALNLIQKLSVSPTTLGRPEVWGDDRRRNARDLIFNKRYSDAYKLASQHHMAPGTVYAELEWLSGFVALRHLNKPEVAKLHFENLLLAVDTPISLGRAFYWLGRALRAMGIEDREQNAFFQGAKYQTSFYGLLSAEEISAPFPYNFEIIPELPDWRTASFRQSSVFQAAILLFAADEDVLAERFINHLAETLEDHEILQMTDFLEEFQKSHVLVTLGKRKASQGKSFPRPYFATHPIINEGYSTPNQLSLAIARRESEFDPNLTSPVGALGLMQVMPRTAREMAKKIGVPYDKKRMLSDWKYNALLGTTYLTELSERFNANPILVSIAYNAGPTRAENWSAILGDPRNTKVDIIDWIEMITFAETRNYVMRTTESIPIYRARLGLDPLPVPFSDFLRGSGF